MSYLDLNTARWLRLKRYAQDEIQQVHVAELDGGRDWRLAGLRVMDALDLRYGPYWRKQTPEDERGRIARDFERRIWPIWKGIFEKQAAAAKSEADLLHRADWAIWKLDYHIDFASAEMDGVAAARRGDRGRKDTDG